MTISTHNSNLRIAGPRLLGRLEALGKIGDTGDGGVRRLALSDEDRQGRDQLLHWMRELKLDIHIDPIGNIVGVMAGEIDGPVVMLGSHIDTVATGGRYDGALGVMAGLEVVATLRDAGVTPHRSIAVIAFTGEEGARFAPDLLGSCVWTGDMTVEEAYAVQDQAGLYVGDEIRRIGYNGGCEPGAIKAHAYVELHIEQGPVLDQSGGGIAAVTGVQAITWLEATVIGEPNHAGTTPMEARRDANYAAAKLLVAARDLTRDISGLRVNSGRFRTEPANVNVVARQSVFSLDMRHPEDGPLTLAETRMRERASDIAAEENVAISFTDLARFPAQPFDEQIVGKVEAAAHRLGLPVRRMPSGAGHDAQMMAMIAPTAMIFVPSINGRSHTPDELTRPEDIVAGANVLLAVALDLAAQ